MQTTDVENMESYVEKNEQVLTILTHPIILDIM